MNKLLAVIDFQNDFVNGSLGFEKAKDLDEKIASRIDEARSDGYDILFTLDSHDDTYLESPEGKKLPVEHCIRGSEGHKLYGKTASRRKDDDKIIEKPTFGSIELAEYLRDKKYYEIELCGLVSDICVLSNAVLAKTFSPNSKVSVIKDLTSTADDKKQEAALSILESIQVDLV